MKFVILGWYGVGNVGDEGILNMVISEITEWNIHTGISVVTFKSGLLIDAKNHFQRRSLPTTKLHYLVNFINKICKCDTLLIGGGGLIQDITHKSIFKGNIPFMFWVVLLAKLVGKRVIFYQVGAGPIIIKFNKLVTRIILNMADLVTVRDKKSAVMLKDICRSRQKIHHLTDPVFLLQPAPEEKVKEILSVKEGLSEGNGSFKIGISVRDWKPHTTLDGKNFLELYNSHLTIFSNFISTILKERNDAQVYFVPFQISYDLKMSKEIKERVETVYKDRVHVIQNEYQPEELLAIVSKMNLFVGMRLHSIIFSIKANIPVIGIEYDPKIRAFMEEFGLKEYCLNTDRLNSASLYQLYQKALSNPTEIRQIMQKGTEMVTRKATHTRQLMLRFLAFEAHTRKK